VISTAGGVVRVAVSRQNAGARVDQSCIVPRRMPAQASQPSFMRVFSSHASGWHATARWGSQTAQAWVLPWMCARTSSPPTGTHLVRRRCTRRWHASCSHLAWRRLKPQSQRRHAAPTAAVCGMAILAIIDAQEGRVRPLWRRCLPHSKSESSRACRVERYTCRCKVRLSLRKRV
jgi:hypothetical protein